ncbi:putative phospholipase B-like 2 [Dermacentor andersoni]|uniref:putative phospholipase B-like 2 n=1 Tax=Dermacentor andersoni TaxID=34620 RepID=UPI003B3A4338
MVWAFLQIETNERAKDEVQAYAAGALEAYLTRQLIENHWTNMFGGYCDSQPEYCRDLKKFFDENNKYSQQQQHLRRHNESFWNMVYLQMKQLAGLSDELENKTLDFSNEVTDAPRAQFLNAQGDIQDLEHGLGREEDFYSIDQIMACSAVVKVVGDSEGLYFGHDAWFVYRAMLRFQKHYIFPWHLTALQTEPEDVVPGHTWTISSYPGMLMSWDSFYLTSGGLELFASLVRNPPRSVAEFRSEATTMEKTLQQRARQYNRDVCVTSFDVGSGALPNNKDILREMVRSVVREELQKLQLAQSPPTVFSLADVIREEVRHVICEPEPQMSSAYIDIWTALGMPPTRPTRTRLNSVVLKMPHRGTLCSVSSLVLNQVPRFLNDVTVVDVWTGSTAVDSASVATRQSASLVTSLVLDLVR